MYQKNTLVKQLIMVIQGEQARDDLQHALGLKSRDHFRKKHLSPALAQQLVEIILPNQQKNATSATGSPPRAKRCINGLTEINLELPPLSLSPLP